MKNLSYKKSDISKISVKGTLSEDATYITYLDDNKDEQTIDIAKCLNLMAGKEIVLNIALKTDEDCSKELGAIDED